MLLLERYYLQQARTQEVNGRHYRERQIHDTDYTYTRSGCEYCVK